MTPRSLFRLAVVPLLVVPVVPLGRADEVQPEPPIVEPFNGKFRLPWKVVRPDEKHWSLKKNKGKLTITTQRGTIHAEADRTDVKAKNLFLINNPYGRNADFEVSVCVSDFKPAAIWHQAGLLLYDDDDNYLKFVWEVKNDKDGGTNLVLIRETKAKPEFARGATPENKGKVWLRLIRRKEQYEYAASGDGKKWTEYGKVSWKDRNTAKIGILAKNGPTDAPEIDACFTDFRARPAGAEPAK